jgi:hypothetical protein|tara:strand:- start:518 stop:6739 length:6222 start_codon:yes stop_codon:yes gene_type:complete
MPEIKHTFQDGKMNKDLDERLVPNGQYRDAMNIQVRTTDADSGGVGEVGTIQNLKGNIEVGKAFTNTGNAANVLPPSNIIASVADEKNNKSYHLVAGANLSALTNTQMKAIAKDDSVAYFVNSIIEVDSGFATGAATSTPVVVDWYGTVTSYNMVFGSTSSPNGSLQPLDGGWDEPWQKLRVLDASLYEVGMRFQVIDITSEIVLVDSVIQNIQYSGANQSISLYDVQVINLPANASQGLVVKTSRDSVLKFNSTDPKTNRPLIITGINIMDGMLFWTDNITEPKKVNIKRCKEGSSYQQGELGLRAHTRLMLKDPSSGDNLVELTDLEYTISPSVNSALKEEHLTVIRKAPRTAPTLEMSNTTRETSTTFQNIQFDFTSTNEQIDGDDDTSMVEQGVELTISSMVWANADYRINDILTFTQQTTGPRVIIVGTIDNIALGDSYGSIANSGNTAGGGGLSISLTILSVTGSLQDLVQSSPETVPMYTVSLQQSKPLFELKLGRFAYRYLYEDGEYSSFGPWSELAFLPGAFDYTHKKGYNLGMVNTLRELAIKDFIPHIRTRPDDVKAIDILYKRVNEPNVYVVKTVTRKRDPEWDLFVPSNLNTNNVFGKFAITSEMIHKALPANQTLRAWDNVPRYAKAQEIVGNRLVYANYTQGYSIRDSVSLGQNVKSLATPTLNDPKKSIKSLRKYKFGLVFGDKYGRETPVISPSYINVDNPDDYVVTDPDVNIDKDLSNKQNLFELTQTWESPTGSVGIPEEWMDYVKYYVKETSNEYYNLVMDKWYEAEDGNVWVSFNSADRNKLSEDTYLVLKNEHGTETPVLESARYKVIAIENEAPDDIKVDKRIMGKVKLGEGSYEYMFEGTPAPETASPMKLMEGTSVKISTGDWGGFLTSYQKQGTLYVRITATNDGGVTKHSDWVVCTHFKNKKEEDSEGMASVHWAKKLGERADMYDKFGGGTVTGMQYFLEFKEDVVESKPEFDGKFFVKLQRDSVLEKKVLKYTDGMEEYDAIATYNIAYIDTVGTNPGLTGPRKDYEWGDDSGVAPAGSDDYTNAQGTNIAAIKANQDDGIENADDVRWFSLGCKGADQGSTNNPVSSSTKLNRADNTKEYWRWFKQEAGKRINTRIFIDGARGKKIEISSVLGGGSGSGYNDDGDAIRSAAYYKPTGIDQGNPSGQGSIPAVIGGELGRIMFSVNSSNGFNYSSGGVDVVGAAFENFMTQEGTEFTFSDDPDENVYRIVSTSETIDRILKGSNFNHCTSDGNDLTGQSTTLSDSSIYNIFSNQEVGSGCGGDCYDWDQENTGAFGWNWNEGNDQEIEPYCKRRGFRVEFRLVNKASGELVDGGTRGINPNIFDPRGQVCHDGREAMRLQVVKKAVTGSEKYIPTASGACWETEPKEDVGLDIYYEASNAIPMVLNRENTVQFAPYNAKVTCRKWYDGTQVNLNAGSETYSTYGPEYVGFVNKTLTEGYINHHVSGIGYTSNSSIIAISSTDVELPNTVTLHAKDFFIGDFIVFHHPDGTLTTSKITAYVRPHQDTQLLSDGSVSNIEEAIYTRANSISSNISVQNIAGYAAIVIQSGDGNATQQNALGETIDLINIGDSVVGQGVPPGVTITFKNQNIITLSDTSWITGDGDLMDFVNNVYPVTFGGSPTGYYEIDSNVYKYPIRLGWNNCYSFGNGVESDRIRDDFNAPQIDNGVKVSTTFLDYGEETKSSGMIYSGIYNSSSGVNDLNEFNMAEKITKDINTSYGSIQALKTRNNDVVVLTEDKILKVIANKDAVFNADGNPQLIATNRVLGTSIPFAGDYGISKNPESLAWDQYRLYFTDMQRGAVLRLSGDGLTPISNVGMKTWFRENLDRSKTLLGTFDTINGEYNLTFKDTETTIAFNENSKGWVSFRSFIPQNGVSVGGKYFTGLNNKIYEHHASGVGRNTFYGDFTPSSFKVIFNDMPSTIKLFKTMKYEGSQSKVIKSTQEYVDTPNGAITVSDGQFYNYYDKIGWEVTSFKTDSNDIGYIPEFINKEGKWFNKISGKTDKTRPDSAEFNTQGLGIAADNSTVSTPATEVTVNVTGDMINNPND